MHEVSPFELASRLSYFLWSSMPDDELLALAESGKLRDAGCSTRRSKRMLADPRAVGVGRRTSPASGSKRATSTSSSRIPQVPGVEPGAARRDEDRDAMFFEHVLRENRPLTDFLDADYTFLNERLAKHYGIDGRDGSGVPPRAS